MKRGDLYRVRHPSSRDPRRSRVFVVVSREALIESSFSTTICAPIYTKYLGLSTQLLVGEEHGLKHESAIHCDELVSLPKAKLTNYIGSLSSEKIAALNQALRLALELGESQA